MLIRSLMLVIALPTCLLAQTKSQPKNQGTAKSNESQIVELLDINQLEFTITQQLQVDLLKRNPKELCKWLLKLNKSVESELTVEFRVAKNNNVKEALISCMRTIYVLERWQPNWSEATLLKYRQDAFIKSYESLMK